MAKMRFPVMFFFFRCLVTHFSYSSLKQEFLKPDFWGHAKIFFLEEGCPLAVSENRGTPKSSILIGFSTINHPFWGTIIFGNTPLEKFREPLLSNLVRSWAMMQIFFGVTPVAMYQTRPTSRSWWFDVRKKGPNGCLGLYRGWNTTQKRYCGIIS